MLEKLNLSKDSKVLVLGAHKGGDAVKVHKRFGCIVYAVEPSNFAFPKLIKASRGKNIIPLKLAIGERNGTATFYEYGSFFPDGKGDSLFGRRHKDPARWRRLFKNPHSNPALWLRKAYRVLCLDVKTLLKHLNLNYVDVLICDCEGAEQYVIEQLIKQPKLVEKFGKLAIEFHPQIYGNELKCQLINEMAKYFNVKHSNEDHILFER